MYGRPTPPRSDGSTEGFTMFEKHREKKLRKQGAQAPAEVLEAQQTHLTSSSGNPNVDSNINVLWKLKVEVRPEGEQPFPADVKAYFPVGAQPAPGQILTVLYDPDDHSQVAVDNSDQAQMEGSIASMVADMGDAPQAAAIGDLMRSVMPDPDAFRKDPRGVAKAMREQMRGQAEQLGAQNGVLSLGGAAAPAPADPVDQLAKLADLRDRGVLSADEFETQKKKILGEPA
ncbi:MAG: hypothetical protein JWM71_978 [Solirubrobacteraceae bacterium]|nr:hypothetical protein [Solirubrobacteraceae bacterium]